MNQFEKNIYSTERKMIKMLTKKNQFLNNHARKKTVL